MGSELPFPFELAASRLPAPGLPAGASAAMPLLEKLGVPSRLASLSGFPGCHRGYVTELADAWLGSLDAKARAEVELFTCGPHGMLVAVAALARKHGVPCQVSLEENMACGVGGCAGCTVLVQTPDGPAMKRVCVDGPVFDAPPCSARRASRGGAAESLVKRLQVARRSERGIPAARDAHGWHHPKLMRASRLVRESALLSASSMSILPSL